MNPFAPLYEICNTGDPAEKYANLRDYPRIIDIELTSSCNFRCLMCPTGNRSLARPAVFMDWGRFYTILNQSEGRCGGFRFIGWGEPTLNPELSECVRWAHGHGILTHLNTNGSKMDAEMAVELRAAGLDSIKFSFQGVDRESYAEMRNINYYDGMIEAIETMRGARLADKPWIAASTTTTYETPEMITAFMERVAPLVDELTIGKTIFDFMDIDAARLPAGQIRLLQRLKAKSSGDQKAHPDPCPEVFDKLSIHADGSVVLCCNDFNGVVELGNVNETPIAELWRHPKIEAYRERLARKDYEAPLCETCFDYMGTTG